MALAIKINNRQKEKCTCCRLKLA